MILSQNTVSFRMTSRFAPSPTGLLHLGHAFSALVAFSRARANGGQFLLRVEDIDAARCRPAFAAAIEEDLAWLGLSWDGPIRVQSRHLAEYGAVLDRLRGEKLIYPCFCSRAEIAREVAQSSSAPHEGPDGAPLYPGTCRGMDAGRRAARFAEAAPHAWRLDMQAALARLGGSLRFEDADRPSAERWQACRPERFGDVVLARRDMAASYHLCVTHDDWVQQVSLVVRGEDLRPATDLHRLLQALLGWTAPAYVHHHLLRDASGRRLAKRDQASTLRALRESGATSSQVWAQVRAAAGEC
ncbi:tRNA glutamyl-Q(34) synthetase GluQRS [Lichenicoccus sp.]|uniref:tRNA glutamyl-Q(34) synthetase GluQRS n=1 Tax=Lichenicoccus sp. TaxID=2781899 RepID=UPI003D0F4629